MLANSYADKVVDADRRKGQYRYADRSQPERLFRLEKPP